MHKSQFSKWLEQRDPQLHKDIINEVNWLNMLGGSGAVLSNILALANSLGVNPELLAQKYMTQHGHVASAHDSHHSSAGDQPPIGGPPNPRNKHIGSHHTNDHGHGHDHTDHLHAHFFGDREAEKESEKMKKFMDKIGNKKFQGGPVTLPTMGHSNDETEEDLDFTVPAEINIPGVGRKPGINPISVGQAQYQQIMKGEKPSIPENPFDFSGNSPIASVNPQISKFASRMQKRR